MRKYDFIVIGVSLSELKIVKSMSLKKAVSMIVSICNAYERRLNKVIQVNFLLSPRVTSDLLMYSA
jgi:hypothetical protein